MTGMFSDIKCDGTLNITGLNKIDTSKVVDMTGLFYGIKIDTLDLSNFDTSNVTGMSSMFEGATVNKIIGLNSFNTSNVTYMDGMFANSSINILDLSSFDIGSDAELDNMFNGTSATVGYAKDEDTADLFNDNSVTGIPDTLEFTVKQ